MAKIGQPPVPWDQIEANRDISADPAFVGWHVMQIVESEAKITKSGDGEMLILVAQVMDGPFKGRKLWINLNIANANAQAEEIAWREFKALAAACGYTTLPEDTCQLHNIPFSGNVKYTPAGPDKKGVTRDARNDIAGGGYKPLNQAGATPAPSGASAAPPAANARPWQQRRAS